MEKGSKLRIGWKARTKMLLWGDSSEIVLTKRQQQNSRDAHQPKSKLARRWFAKMLVWSYGAVSLKCRSPTIRERFWDAFTIIVR
jgi:hypothetical protein